MASLSLSKSRTPTAVCSVSCPYWTRRVASIEPSSVWSVALSACCNQGVALERRVYHVRRKTRRLAQPAVASSAKAATSDGTHPRIRAEAGRHASQISVFIQIICFVRSLFPADFPIRYDEAIVSYEASLQADSAIGGQETAGAGTRREFHTHANRRNVLRSGRVERELVVAKAAIEVWRCAAFAPSSRADRNKHNCSLLPGTSERQRASNRPGSLCRIC